MAQRGDSFIYTIIGAYSDWGRIRHTDTRDPIAFEGYIPIKSDDAYTLNIRNRRGANEQDVWGLNLFHCESSDGLFSATLLAQGNQHDPNYAKQFSVIGDLKALGRWYHAIGAQEGDRILVRWVSDTDIVIEKV